MSSPGWLVLFLLLALINLIIGNVFSGEPQPLTTDDTDYLSESSQYTTTEEQTTSGSMIAFFNTSGKVLAWISRAASADYDFFYNYDLTTQTRIPNEAYIFRYYFLLVNFAVIVTIGFMIWGRT